MLDKKSVEVEFGNYGDLVCPRCSGAYLHHQDVIVFNRQEDDDVAVKTVVNGGGVMVETRDGSGDNPSRRRDGLIIRFWCETCAQRDERQFFDLAIYQHKGASYVEWRIEDIAQ